MTESQSFLSLIADKLLEKYKNSLSNLCVIMPSNRSIVHLKYHLHQKIKGTFLLPDFLSIEEFMQQISGLSTINPEELLIMLYNINKKINVFDKHDFYDFIGDAKIVLQDFNDIDLSLANPEDVFSSLSSIKEMSFFGKEESQLSDYQRKYLNFFRNLHHLYTHFKEELLKNKTAYQGLLYRIAFEKREEITRNFPYEKYVFVGFNALQQAEWGIVDYLIKEQLADFYVDADKWYMEDGLQEAGVFLRKLKKNLNLTTWNFEKQYIETIPKKVKIMGFPQGVLQTTCLSNILASIGENKTTAIVLADETLLLPVLHAIDTSKANITMGLSMRNTQLYKLIYNLFVIIENKLKSGDSIYHKDLSLIFNNPYIQSVLKESGVEVDVFLENYLKKGKLYYNKEELMDLCNIFPSFLKQILADLYEKISDAESVTRYISEYLNMIKNYKTDLEGIDKQIIDLFLDHMSYLTELFQRIEHNIKSYRFIFEQFASTLSLSFKSNPMSSLQIMGMLETRTLDFDHVIILSVNEGIIPSEKSLDSFLPYDVKSYYNLPTFTQNEAIFSYHFYRLLQRAKSIFLLYSLDSQTKEMEKSRFIRQINSEWNRFSHISISETVMAYPKIKTENPLVVKITKTEDILKTIQSIPHFSPSMLNRYLSCPLKFYYQDVLKVKETESITEEIQANVIGSVVHKVLESVLNNQYARLTVPTSKQLEDIVLQSFLDSKVTHMELKEEDLMYEQNHLIFHIVLKYVKDYLEIFNKQLNDKTISSVIDFEKKLECMLEGNSFPIYKLKGIADRLDNRGGVVTVVDYKTGRVDSNSLKIKNIEDLFSGDFPVAFQLMFYAFLQYKSNNQTPLNAQIVSFRSIKEELKLSIDGQIELTETLFQEFAILLQQTIANINNSNLSFTQTDKQERCEWCEYNKICMREL
ncbi:MAG: DUF2800 domain-containing protein [Bacteroidales bacterium]|nr:DUF2800 domain-containing protein [Bacteroidales bacterium]